MMTLDNFETFTDEKILIRGIKYYNTKRVEFLDEKFNGVFVAIVEGTDSYKVIVKVTDKGEIKESSCNCPYQYQCKHEIATYFAIREYKEDEIETIEIIYEKGIRADLQKFDKSELIEILAALTERNEAVCKDIQAAIRLKEVVGQ